MYHRACSAALAYNSNRSWLVSGSDSGTVVVWDLTRGPAQRLATLAVPPNGSVVDVAMNSDGRLVAAAGLDNRSVSLWRLPSGEPVGEPVVLGGRAWAVAFSPRGGELAVGGADGLLLVDTATGAPVGPPWPAGGKPLTSVAYDRTGRLASGGHDAKVRIWEWGSDSSV